VPVSVDVVNVELADVYWLELAVLAVVLLVDCVWVSTLDDSTPVDCVAPVLTGNGLDSAVSYLDFCRSTD
jgi:hypothetical protein